MSERPPRLGVTVTQEMYDALEEESRKLFNTPVAALVRQAIQDWLETRGHELQEEITRGGYRGQKAEESPGQRAGLAA